MRGTMRGGGMEIEATGDVSLGTLLFTLYDQ